MAGKKITELPELGATPASGDWLVVVDVSDTSESPEGTTKKVLKSDAIPEGVPYLSCAMLVSQSGTSIPTAVILENTLGVTFTFSRDSSGEYKINFSPSLSSSNILTLANSGGSTYNDCFVVFHDIAIGGIYFSNYGNGGGLQDDFTNMSMEIRVYP